MATTAGERQIGKKLGHIKQNHVERYRFAIRMLKKHLPEGGFVLDAASGVGYGSKMIAEHGFAVIAVDRAAEAEEYQKYFEHPGVRFIREEIDLIKRHPECGSFGAIVSLETIEHVAGAAWELTMRETTDLVIGTVPNQDVIAFNKHKHPWHYRHYTKTEISDLFRFWVMSDWHTQYDKTGHRSKMIPGDDGMTLGFVASRRPKDRIAKVARSVAALVERREAELSE